MRASREPLDRRPEPLGEVIRAIAAYGVPHSSLELPQHPFDDDTWTKLRKRVWGERLYGLLGAAVDDRRFAVTPTQREDVLAIRRHQMGTCLHLEGQLIRAERILRAADISVRVLKGPAAANLDYVDPLHRPFVDIDLLVQADDFDAAVRTLAVVGGYHRKYPEPRPGFDRRFSKGAALLRADGTVIDLHRTFVMGPFGLTVRLDDLWADSRAFMVAGHKFHALSNEMRLLHACYHAVLGDWPRRALPHRDIVELVLGGHCDDARTLELSQRWQADAVLALGLAGAWDLLSIVPEPPLVSWARTVELTSRDLRAVGLYSNDANNYAAKSWGAVRQIPGLRSKAAFLRALMLPDRAYVRDRHQTSRTRAVQGLRQILLRRRGLAETSYRAPR